MFPKRAKKQKYVYLDNAAATRVDEVLLSQIKKYNIINFENPSGLYSSAVDVRKELNNSRKKIANILKTQPDSILFTGSGTESVNLAILGLARKYKKFGKHIISTKIEHHAVLKSLEKLSKEGYEVTYLAVDAKGKIDINELKKSIRKDTILISIMYANNEIGTINDLPLIGREIIKWRKNTTSNFPYLHTDACQAGSYLNLGVEKIHADLMSLNSSKVHGPKGVGLLYKRKGVEIEPIMFGGEQEYGLRPGTENVAGIITFAHALQIAETGKEKNTKKIQKLQEYFWNTIKNNIPDVKLVGPEFGGERLVNNLNILIKNIDAESLIIYLDKYGIICGSGSACTNDSDDVSHVLLACGYSETEAKSNIRFSMSKYTTKSDINYVIKYLVPIVAQLRK